MIVEEKKNLFEPYLGNDARRSARNFVNRSVIEPNCFKDISHSSSGSGCIGFLDNKKKTKILNNQIAFFFLNHHQEEKIIYFKTIDSLKC